MEFAIIAPVILLLIGGIVEFGAVLRAYAAVNRMTMQFAQSFADCPDTTVASCGSELSQYTSSYTIANYVPQLLAARVSLSIAQVQFAGATANVTYPSNGVLTSAQSAALTTLYAGVPATYTGTTNAVVVTGSYTYSLLFFNEVMAPFIGNNFTISYTVAQTKS